MSEDRYTKERLSACNGGECRCGYVTVAEGDGFVFKAIGKGDDVDPYPTLELQKGNAKRLVALWNATLDIPTSTLSAEGVQVVAWQPFETAPMNRTEILAYRPDAGVFVVIYCPARTQDGEEDEDNCCWFTAGGGEDLTGDLPTHWMPLPKGPNEKDGESHE